MFIVRSCFNSNAFYLKRATDVGLGYIPSNYKRVRPLDSFPLYTAGEEHAILTNTNENSFIMVVYEKEIRLYLVMP